MSNPLYAFPAACEQTLRALARYPERTAFSWPGGSITYRGTTDMIGRIQSVFMQLGFAPGTRVAFLSANRADTWCASGAAQLSRFAITWLHRWARWTINCFNWKIPKRRCWWSTA
jgi:fatty-acyl-CoA synthase